VDALYQKQILEFARHSRASAFDETAPLTATLDNPVCGDRVTLSMAVVGGTIGGMGVKVRGCALCEAGAGLLLHSFDGVTPDDARQMTEGFSAWLANQNDTPPTENMAKFMPVREIRNRHKCVLLAFETALAALTAGD
jgi:nitrogen fixation NifU-like protein